jgi:hypothetical protein
MHGVRALNLTRTIIAHTREAIAMAGRVMRVEGGCIVRDAAAAKPRCCSSVQCAA